MTPAPGGREAGAGGQPELSPAAWTELLSIGEIEVLGRMPWSSNATFLVVVSDDEVAAQAIYKPGRGERPLWDFPDGIFRREVAAYVLSNTLGAGIVPETVLREDAPYGEGSLQRFIDADYETHYFTMLDEPDTHDALRLIAAFDVLANNADRKGGHLLRDASGRIWGIDHGLCFHVEPKLRTVMWDFAGEELSSGAIELLSRFEAVGPTPLAPYLDAAELDALVERARRLRRNRRYPAPGASRRSHPWPLV